MAGRILPIALATVVGVSIGVTTFDSEFKEQRRKKLEEEYNREVAAAAAAKGQAPVPITTSAVPAPPLESLPVKHVAAAEETTRPTDSSWSSMLGLWAWKKGAKNSGSQPAPETASSQQPAVEPKSKP
ncbi:hypothetical protein FB567DRAFT_589954 [Paraphoma chrysanthemicola]|uniref:Uncharacterized protein n=1 Tax=Paraphoma chrysanthemicola TaxID=798071 RepID=A0A8K0W196_9PLEO|nr:hypothetical protein FB567DRAFT_589954 [Paraphoma chrysanthemicola]